MKQPLLFPLPARFRIIHNPAGPGFCILRPDPGRPGVLLRDPRDFPTRGLAAQAARAESSRGDTVVLHVLQGGPAAGGSR